jgi:hypothetical protein
MSILNQCKMRCYVIRTLLLTFVRAICRDMLNEINQTNIHIYSYRLKGAYHVNYWAKIGHEEELGNSTS